MGNIFIVSYFTCDPLDSEEELNHLKSNQLHSKTHDFMLNDLIHASYLHEGIENQKIMTCSIKLQKLIQQAK